jgi:hypothetical protein
MVTVVANSADSHRQSSDQESANSGTASRVDRYMGVLRHSQNIFVPIFLGSYLQTDPAPRAAKPCVNATASVLEEWSSDPTVNYTTPYVNWINDTGNSLPPIVSECECLTLFAASHVKIPSVTAKYL